MPDLRAVTGHPVVLFMKGSPQFPQCGFSASAIQILKASGIDKPFTVDVLQDEEIRQGIKHYANWPTIPQLYVNGEFVGGADILREMYQSGELQQMVGPKGQFLGPHEAFSCERWANLVRNLR